MVPVNLMLESLRRSGQQNGGSSGRWLQVAILCAAALAAALLARLGTPWARLAAAGVVLAAVVFALVRHWRIRRARGDARALLAATVVRSDPELGERTLRALDLVDQAKRDPAWGSVALARLHLSRLLDRAPLGAIARRAARSAWRCSAAALGVTSVGLAITAADPFRVVEGADVALARDGSAPLALEWFDDRVVTAEPPAYLQLPALELAPFAPTALPQGSRVIVRGRPLRQGRALVLTDGRREARFTEDGAGLWVARLAVERDAELWVAARFGDVLVPEPRRLSVFSLPDLPPRVRLKTAPRTVALLDEPTIAIEYEAIDDQALEEVCLVLRAGDQEHRRVLSKPPAGTRLDRGGMELHASDDILRRTHLPVEVTVEARDNDPVAGPKWGRSRAIIVVPPRIGEREAQRHRALREARDALTDLLAVRLGRPIPTPRERAAYLAAEREAQRRAREQIASALERSFGDLSVPGRLSALIQGQMQRLDRVLGEARLAPVTAAHQRLVETTESVLLALDAGLGLLGRRDAARTARKLSEVAGDAARSAALVRVTADRERSDRKLQAALGLLDGGAAQLVELGPLGCDLGEIAYNGVRRIRRAWQAGDVRHAELAAEDLAARLRVPSPSFASAGGSRSGGVESGGRAQPQDLEPSQAAREAQALYEELERLRQEHAGEVMRVEQALRRAGESPDDPAEEQERRQSAQAVRKAAASLPRMGAQARSARAAAAAARAHAEAMAAALESGNLEQAARRGEEGLEALGDAQRLAGGDGSGPPDPELARRLATARGPLSRALEQARRALRQSRQKASENASAELDRAAQREAEMARRAAELQQRSQQGEAPMPEALLERLGEAARAMTEASRELRARDGHRGLERQREAQRLLEMAEPPDEDQAPMQQGAVGEGQRMAQNTSVPDEQPSQEAERFRQRVTEGLRGRVPPHLRDALRRYSEGLLR